VFDMAPLSALPHRHPATRFLVDEAFIGMAGESMVRLRAWAEDIATQLRSLGVRTYPKETYFFLADFAPHDAAELAENLKLHAIPVKPLNERHPGPGYLRVTTALPADNASFIATLRALS